MMIKCVFMTMMLIMMMVMANTNEQYNSVEFKQLCKILKVAEGEPEKIPDELGKFMETRTALETLLRATKTSTATYQKVVKLSSTDEEDADFISYTVKRKTANEKIQHAMEKVKDIYSRMEEELIQASRERTQAKNNLVHSIYGARVGELPKEEEIPMVLQNVSLSSISNRNGGEKRVKYHETSTNPTCGGVGESGAGFTLINDFYCLCVGKDNNNKVCHEQIKGPGKWQPAEDCKECKDCCKDGNCCCCCGEKCGQCKCDNCICDKQCNCQGNQCKKCVFQGTWLNMTKNNGSNNELDLPRGWPHIRKVCGEVSEKKTSITASSIQEVLDDFNKLLGSNSSKQEITPKTAEMDARRLFILGYVKEISNNKGCNGNRDGVCVNYWAASNLGIGIVWQNYMLEAQKHLKTMHNHIKKAKQLYSMIQKLKESAEESYRKNAHGSMLWPIEEGCKKKFHNLIIFLACLF
ncbi:Variant surface glycoprotein [Trypanosoma congolense IL3000]|uniref:Variant surface glycoprotein n=1 Tax=Trypanosoma congolense (strain IL3000) TaxID=1068625 RepID=F9WA70_TRYCI|nr:Variant surface glycoprotein [Trypanosoma congolense IL3000]